MAKLRLAVQFASGMIEYKGRIFTPEDFAKRMQMLKVKPIFMKCCKGNGIKAYLHTNGS